MYVKHYYLTNQEHYEQIKTYVTKPPYGVRKFLTPSNMSKIINQSFLYGDITTFTLLVMQQIDRFLFGLINPELINGAEKIRIINQLRFIKAYDLRSQIETANFLMKCYVYLDYYFVERLLPICYKKGNFNRNFYKTNAKEYQNFVNYGGWGLDRSWQLSQNCDLRCLSKPVEQNILKHSYKTTPLVYKLLQDFTSRENKPLGVEYFESPQTMSRLLNDSFLNCRIYPECINYLAQLYCRFIMAYEEDNIAPIDKSLVIRVMNRTTLTHKEEQDSFVNDLKYLTNFLQQILREY